MAPAWFRFYSEALNDPKVQQLSGNDFKAWVNLLCIASEREPRGTLPTTDAEIGFALRMPAKKAGELLWKFCEYGLIDIDQEARTMTMHGWGKRQYASDDVTERVRRHRERGNVSNSVVGNVTETPPEQKQIQSRSEAESDTEQSRAERAALAAKDYDPDWDEIREEAQNLYGLLPGHMVQEMRSYLEAVGIEWFRLGLKETREKADRPSWKFTKACLDTALAEHRPPGPRPKKIRAAPGSARAQILERAAIAR